MRKNQAVVEKLRNRARSNKKLRGSTFCGTTHRVVSCQPGECYRFEDRCNRQHKVLIEANRGIIQALADTIISKTPMMPLQEQQAMAIREYGNVVGELVAIMLKYPNVGISGASRKA